MKMGKALCISVNLTELMLVRMDAAVYRKRAEDREEILMRYLIACLALCAGPALAQVDDDSIVARCDAEWGNDFQMVAFCRDQQRTAGSRWVSIVDGVTPDTPADSIVKRCLGEWGDDYQMLVFCHDQQQTALQTLATKPDDIPEGVFETIVNRCDADWGDDFQMVNFCRNQQVTAWRSLQ